MSGFIVAFYVGESGSLQTVRPAGNPGGRRAAFAARRARRSGGVGQGGERQLSRRAHHPEQVPVQAAAAVLPWQRAGGRGEGSRRGREQRAARRQGDGLHHLRRVCRGGENRRGAAAADSGRHGFQDRGRIRAHLRHLGPCIARPRLPAGRRHAARARRRRRSRPRRDRDRQGALRARIKNLTEGRGVDVIYDPVGGAYSEPAFRSIAWRGRLLVVGFAAGEIPKLPLNLALLKGASVVGVFWGDFARREPKAFGSRRAKLGLWFREGKLRPHVSKIYPLEKAADALRLMAARQVKGKVVLAV